jgi:hypothetical protein
MSPLMPQAYKDGIGNGRQYHLVLLMTASYGVLNSEHETQMTISTVLR